MSTPQQPPALPPELSPRGPAPRTGLLARRRRPAGPSGPQGPAAPVAAGGTRRWAMVATGAVSALVLTFSVVGTGLASYYESKTARVDVIDGGSSGDGTAQNFLLVGSDNREGLTRSQVDALHIGAASSSNGAGRRSDTMILLHLSATSDKATLISLPRDSYVTIPAFTDAKGVHHPATKNKLNSAYERGGPKLAVQTVELATGVHIDHYVEIGFEGFVTMVDAVGGVQVCSDTALKDPKSGLDIPAGTTKLNGTNALKYVRARYVDASSDLGRMKRQQAFLGSLFREATSAGTLLDPLKLNSFLSATLSSVTLDSGLTRDDLLSLATRTKGLSPSNVVFMTVPLSNVDYRPSAAIGSTVLWSPARSAALFGAVRADQPIGGQTSTASGSSSAAGTGTPVAVAPSHISVKVLNAGGVTGVGGRASNDLQKMGFAIAAPAANATQHGATRTVIQYDPGWNTSVKTLQAVYPYAALTPVKGLGKTFVVLVGSDYRAPKPVTVTASSSPGTSGPGGVATTSAAQTVCKTSS